MNDKELAQLAVGFGVGLYLITDQKHSMLPGPEHHFELDGRSMSDSEFVRDWRVAGALMEKFNFGHLSEIIGGAEFWTTEANPRTIIEACLEANAEN